MLDVKLYENSNYFKESNFDQRALLITPSPKIADALRELVSDHYEIITISKWIGDFLKTKKLKKKNKSELFLELASVWRNYFKDNSFNLFYNSFEVFTDIRSYTLNIDLLADFVNELPVEIKKSIMIFYAYFETEKIIDEHLAYHMMRSFKFDRELHFVGFKHMSGVQLDMLNEISQETDVKLYIPQEVYNESVPTDWVRWVNVNSLQSVSEAIKNNLVGIKFPKNKLNFSLPSILERYKGKDIILMSKDSNYDQLQEVVGDKYHFKTSVDIFSSKVEELILKLKHNLPDLDMFIVNQLKLSAQNNDFRFYKVCELANEAINVYRRYSPISDEFLIDVVKEIIALNLPRLNMMTFLNNEKREVLDLGNITFKHFENAPILIATSSYGKLAAGNFKYSDRMVDGLKNIGPVKRGGLDYLFIRSELKNLLKMENAVLVFEEGLDSEDQNFKGLIENFKVENLVLDFNNQFKNSLDYLKYRIDKKFSSTRFSASKIQTFIDCKRKFYFEQIDPILHTPEEKLVIAKKDLGTIEHKIIEEYFKVKTEFQVPFEQSLHDKICQTLLLDFIQKKNLNISNQEMENALFEIKRLSQNGIEKILDRCRTLQEPRVVFEEPLEKNDYGLSGFIDCLIVARNYLGIFDFKRSASAIGNKGDTKNFTKIQIWIYLLNYYRSKSYQTIEFGYLNLSEIEDSLILQAEGEVQIAELDEKVHQEFRLFLESTIQEIKDEEIFSPRPRNIQVCNYCELKLVCTDRESEEDE